MARYLAVFDFVPEKESDLGFKEGDVLWVLSKSSETWWFARSLNGSTGYVPFNYIEPFPEKDHNEEKEAVLALDVENEEETFSGIDQETEYSQRNIGKDLQNNSLDVVEVLIKEPIPTYGQSFNVTILFKNRRKLKASKKMRDFRILCNAVNILHKSNTGITGFDVIERVMTTIPCWADNIKIPKHFVKDVMIARAGVLKDWIQSLLFFDIDEKKTINEINEMILEEWMTDAHLQREYQTESMFLDMDKKEGTEQIDRKRIMEAFFLGQNLLKEQWNFKGLAVARSVYKWKKRKDVDISLEKNEIFVVKEESEFEQWSIGEKVNGNVGLVPDNYIKILSNMEKTDFLKPFRRRKSVFKIIKNTNDSFIKSSDDFNSKEKLNKKIDNITRKRRRIQNFTLGSSEIFDRLTTEGMAVVKDGKLIVEEEESVVGYKDHPRRGDTVTVLYAGFVWDPQGTELLEFSTSDVLLADADEETGPLIFTIGLSQAIEGLEKAVCSISIGDSVRVIISPEQAFGEVGMPPLVPGNAYVVYDIILEKVARRRSSFHPGARLEGARRQSVTGERQELESVKSRRRSTNIKGLTENDRSSVFDPVAIELSRTLTLKKCQEIVREGKFIEYGVKPSNIEKLLIEEDFLKYLGVRPNQWEKLPAFLKRQRKKKVKLL